MLALPERLKAGEEIPFLTKTNQAMGGFKYRNLI